MNKLTAIRIKYDNNTYSNDIPISVLADNVEWDSTHNIKQVLGNVDVSVSGTIQDQINILFKNMLSDVDLQNYVDNSLHT